MGQWETKVMVAAGYFVGMCIVGAVLALAAGLLALALNFLRWATGW